jgi:hypothetical protein
MLMGAAIRHRVEKILIGFMMQAALSFLPS